MDSLRALVNQKLPPTLDPNAYLGTYMNQIYGKIEIKNSNGNLNIFFENHPNLIGKLEHIRDDVFLCEYSNPSMGIVSIPFKVQHQKVTGITLKVTPNIEFTPYEFTKLD